MTFLLNWIPLKRGHLEKEFPFIVIEFVVAIFKVCRLLSLENALAPIVNVDLAMLTLPTVTFSKFVHE